MATIRNNTSNDIKERTQRRSFFIRFIISAILLWVIVGIYVFPAWWLAFVSREFGAELSEILAIQNVGVFVAYLLVMLFISIVYMRYTKRFVFLNWINSSFHSLLMLIGLLFLFQGFCTLPGRTITTQIAPIFTTISNLYEEYRPLVERISDDSKKPPLSEPRTILFIDEVEIESLYSQYEDELIPAIIVQEMQGSLGFKGSFSYGNILEAGVDKTEIQKKSVEYRKQPKTPQRKLKDLLAYLHSNLLYKPLSTFRSSSKEIRDIDSAMQTLQVHTISFDQERVSMIREDLLQMELSKFIEDLSSTEGLVIIMGDWCVKEIDDKYLFTHRFTDYLNTPPECYVTVPKTSTLNDYMQIYSNADNTRLKLTVFGSVIKTTSQLQHSLKVRALAIF